MPYAKNLVADSVAARLIEAQGIYQYCNRSLDGIVRQGATSVDVPNLPGLVVRTVATTDTDGTNRKRTKSDTAMVNVPLAAGVVPIADEILGQFESNGMLMKEFTISAALTFQEHFDKVVVTEALTTTNAITDFATLGWAQIAAINKGLDLQKVPKTGRIIAISANLADSFYAIDVVKNAMAYNIAKFESGQFISVMGMKFFISANVPLSTTKNQIVGFYGPGIAFVLSKYMELKSRYDEANLRDIHDLMCHFGTKLLNVNYAVKGKEA